MPLYDYLCDDCGHESEEFQHMQDDPQEICPECSSDTWHRLFSAPMLIQIDGGTTTLGALADRNGERMSDDEKAHALRNQKTLKKFKHELPKGMTRDEHKPEKKDWPGQTESTDNVAQMDTDQQQNYIETGDKNG